MTTAAPSLDSYRRASSGIHVPATPVEHRDGEYDSDSFDLLRDMQVNHFWYRGRHRFLLRAFQNAVAKKQLPETGMQAVDLGGGCGGWVKYLKEQGSAKFGELALADSSTRALEMAEDFVGEDVSRYQIDLLQLGWKNRWDAAFLLDVLEHIPDHEAALRQIYSSLRPGGLLFVTTPALKFFWSSNDELVHHCRRYSRGDYRELAANTGFELVTSRYFMFFLSPMYLLSRLTAPRADSMSQEQIAEHLRRSHRTPAAPLNGLLSGIFAMETPLGLTIPFPWGTSILAVLRRPT